MAKCGMHCGVHIMCMCSVNHITCLDFSVSNNSVYNNYGLA